MPAARLCKRCLHEPEELCSNVLHQRASNGGTSRASAPLMAERSTSARERQHPRRDSNPHDVRKEHNWENSLPCRALRRGPVHPQP